ncbi:hypothetical protein [Achromobacter sp.]|jgi:hypothetical protein|uniref:hypothetical protein n=1 Tax=Achromobacter sp. TaxID=134375 RepID=UPI003D067B10
MNAPSFRPGAACPACGANLEDADVEVGIGVAAEGSIDGKAQLGVLITCYECESEFTALIPVGSLLEVGK